MLYLLLLTLAAALVWRLLRALRRLWRAVPRSNHDFFFLG